MSCDETEYYGYKACVGGGCLPHYSWQEERGTQERTMTYSSKVYPCDNFHNSGSHKLMYVNTYSSFGRTFGEELGGVILLEELCIWGWTLRFYKLLPISVPPPSLSLFLDKDVNSQLLF